MIELLDKEYNKRNSQIKIPKIIQADNQFNNNVHFKKWCDDNEIRLNITVGYNHRQNTHVEGLNRIIGSILWKYQVDKEITNKGKPYSEWMSIHKPMVEKLNEIRSKQKNTKSCDITDENIDKKLSIKQPTQFLNIGDIVRLKLDQHESLQGKPYKNSNKNSNFRSTDIKWKYNPKFEIIDIKIIPGGVITYKIKNKMSGQPLNAYYSAERLQKI
jgi:hypothetical protein